MEHTRQHACRPNPFTESADDATWRLRASFGQLRFPPAESGVPADAVTPAVIRMRDKELDTPLLFALPTPRLYLSMGALRSRDFAQPECHVICHIFNNRPGILPLPPAPQLVSSSQDGQASVRGFELLDAAEGYDKKAAAAAAVTSIPIVNKGRGVGWIAGIDARWMMQANAIMRPATPKIETMPRWRRACVYFRGFTSNRS